MAKKDISSIVSGAGLLTSFWTELMVQVQKHGGSDDDIHRLVRPEGAETIARIAELIVGSNNVFSVSVDYSMSLTQMILAGKYDWVNDNITQEHFPISGNGTVELNCELVHFGKSMSTDAVPKELDRRGYRPATLQELLAFGAQYPEKQREFPIVALGSVRARSSGGRHVPYLCGRGSSRGLGLYWCDDDWGAYYRFLACRK